MNTAINISSNTPRLTIIGISLATDNDKRNIPFSIVIKPITFDKTLCLIVISHRLIIIIALETPKYIGETSLNAGVLILAIKNPANKITLDITKQ